MSKILDTVTGIALVAHEANRAWCAANGDFSQPKWSEAPAWQKDSAIAGVRFHMANPYASVPASHESWLAQKIADGWVYGETKNPDLKQHPCMVSFDQLPPVQQAKDRLFKSIVHALAEGLTDGG